MPLSRTHTAQQGDLVIHKCDRMAGGPGYVQVPGAGPVLCSRPCGGKCPYARTSCPLPTAREVVASLRLRATAGRLLATAHGPVVPAGFFVADATQELLDEWHPGRN